MNKGEIVEYGPFSSLLKNNGILTKLMGESFRIIDSSLVIEDELPYLDQIQQDNDEKEVNNEYDKIFGRSKKTSFSSVTISDSIEDVLPTDAEPMKLVCQDQSVNYNASPILLYLKSGWGVFITLCIFAFFFVIYIFRIISGNFCF